MINRVLIRTKVIQILYSFLLVEKQFTLESSPSAPTKEKRFAYSLYLDVLVLLIKVAGLIERRKGEYPLRDTRFIVRLKVDEVIKSQLSKYAAGGFPLEGVVAPLAEAIAESGIYKTYLKDLDKDVPAAEERVWKEIFDRVVMTDRQFLAAVAERQNYTLKGLERMQDMVNRTMVNFLASQDNVDEVEAALADSLSKARELYFRLLTLPVELTDMQERRLDENRFKFLPTDEDINPNMRFVENSVVAGLREDPRIVKYMKDNKDAAWYPADQVLLQHLLKAVTESQIYADYMAAPECDRHADAELWRQLLRNVILTDEQFLESLEEKSVFWNDDLEIMGTFAAKTFRRMEDEPATAVLDQYKDEEDRTFGSQLLRYVYRNKDTYRSWIDEALTKERWDSERLSFMDVVIMETALAEIMNFHKIPLTVSINEYIELAKSYSSAKAGSFVHGILGAITARLKKERILMK